MREIKYHTYLDSGERLILLQSLVELIFKVTNTPLKKLKVWGFYWTLKDLY